MIEVTTHFRKVPCAFFFLCATLLLHAQVAAQSNCSEVQLTATNQTSTLKILAADQSAELKTSFSAGIAEGCTIKSYHLRYQFNSALTTGSTFSVELSDDPAAQIQTALSTDGLELAIDIVLTEPESEDMQEIKIEIEGGVPGMMRLNETGGSIVFLELIDPDKTALDARNRAISVYPHPIQDRYTLENPTRWEIPYQLFSTSGELIENGRLAPCSQEQHNGSDLINGLYLLRYSLENQAHCQRIQIAH